MVVRAAQEKKTPTKRNVSCKDNGATETNAWYQTNKELNALLTLHINSPHNTCKLDDTGRIETEICRVNCILDTRFDFQDMPVLLPLFTCETEQAAVLALDWTKLHKKFYKDVMQLRCSTALKGSKSKLAMKHIKTLGIMKEKKRTPHATCSDLDSSSRSQRPLLDIAPLFTFKKNFQSNALVKPVSGWNKALRLMKETRLLGRFPPQSSRIA